MNIITLKLKYQIDGSTSRIIEMIKNYNSIFGIIYNFMFDNQKSSTKTILDNLKTKNNIFLDTYFRNGAIYDAKSELSKNKDKKIIFGGRSLFIKRAKDKISKEDFQHLRLRPLTVVGAAYNKGNCKFQILSSSQILFKPNSKEHFILNLKSVGKNYSKKLEDLILFQNACQIPITYRLSENFVYISFDSSVIKDSKFKKLRKVKNRIFAIDLNPNYIGWSVVDWKSESNHSTVNSGVISLKPLNDYESSLHLSSEHLKRLYVANKRKYEVIHIGYELCELANHFRCEIFALEDLAIQHSDSRNGKRFNRLCNNQWCRNLLVNLISKLNEQCKIKTIKVKASYSSFLGNLVYREEKLPDMCLSSIEIGRRAYEFNHQYILKDKEIQKNIIFDKLENVKNRINKSLEEFGYLMTWSSLSELYSCLKKRNCRYRFPLEDAAKTHPDRFSRKIHIKSFKICYIFT